MALVIAAGVFMGDLIAALAYLLRGELTSRFLAKSFVVLTLSGGVFFYYFGGLRKTDGTTPRLSRDKLMAGISSAIVAIMVVLGFSQSGPPRVQRELRADSQRVNQLYRLSTAIRNYWTSHASQLPTGIDQLPGTAFTDPITHAPYEYRPTRANQYELCAVFARDTEPQVSGTGPNPWVHRAGHQCFPMDAAVTAEMPTQFYPY